VDSYAPIVDHIRGTLQLDDEWASKVSKFDEALELLTQRIEDIGVIVFFSGVVESNTSRPINVDECRGFVLVDELAPCMFVNAADAKAGQLFTLVHELAHIWTGQSAGFDFGRLQPADDPIERLCDQVAAEFLVPTESFNRVWKQRPSIEYIARHFKVSQIVIARRALDLRHITKAKFYEFYNAFMAGFKLRKQNQASGGDFYATTRKRLSLAFAGRIDQAVKSNRLLYRDAYKLTGLKGGTYQTFFNKHYLKR
jgi:Zn-dependent peptidase ImmA (M78 family)